MPSFHPLHVAIHDGGTETKLEEYKVVTAVTETECWIESKLGSLFTVNMSLTRDVLNFPEAFVWKVYVDGQVVDKVLMGFWDLRSVKVLRGVYITEDIYKPFRFAKTRFKEYGLSDKNLLNALGTITVTVQRVRAEGLSENQTFRGYHPSTSKSVNEKAKKALLTHSVECGDPVLRPSRSQYWRTTEIDPDYAPLHTFTFKYRSRDILEADKIVPSRHGCAAGIDVGNDHIAGLVNNIGHVENGADQLKRRVKHELGTASPEICDLTEPVRKKRKNMIDLTE